MWSFLCSSVILASMDLIPAGSGAGALIGSAEEACARISRAACGLAAAACERSPEAANKGLAKAIAPSRDAAAIVTRAARCVNRIMMCAPYKLFRDHLY